MSFKIVQTEEESGSTLSIVPTGWVIDNELYWPIKPHEFKLVKDKNSQPKMDAWSKYKCKTKREFLDTYTKALDVLNQMAADSDSDISSSYKKKAIAKKKLARQHIGRTNQTNFNAIAEACLSQDTLTEDKQFKTPTKFLKPKVLPPAGNYIKNSITPPRQLTSVKMEQPVFQVIENKLLPQNSFIQQGGREIEAIYMPCNVNGELDLFETEVQNNDDVHMNYIASIEELEDTCQQNQQQVYLHSPVSFENVVESLQQSLQCTEIKQQEIITRLEKIEKNQEILLGATAQIMTMLEKRCNPLTRNLEISSEPNLIFKKICDINELNQFETNLNDEDFKASIIQQLKLVCGADGKNNGVTCAYHLSDAMLERNLITKLSWAGGSKTTESKHALKTYTKFLQLFFDLILLADNQFNEIKLHKFFKTVIKNSKQRATSIISRPGKKNRESSGRNRVTSAKNLKCNHNVAEEQRLITDNHDEISDEEIPCTSSSDIN